MSNSSDLAPWSLLNDTVTHAVWKNTEPVKINRPRFGELNLNCLGGEPEMFKLRL